MLTLHELGSSSSGATHSEESSNHQTGHLAGHSSLGELYLNVTLLPRTAEDREHYIKSGRVALGSSEGTLTGKKMKTQQWDAVVNIVLVEAKLTSPHHQPDPGPSSIFGPAPEGPAIEPFVKFRIATEKYKSKPALTKTGHPVWGEQFVLHTFPDQPKLLELSLHDRQSRDELMGELSVNLLSLPREETHQIKKGFDPLPGGKSGYKGWVLLLITISGTQGTDAESDLNTWTPGRADQLRRRDYGIKNSFKAMNDIGYLVVKGKLLDLMMRSDRFLIRSLISL